jgi:hypothetical protein
MRLKSSKSDPREQRVIKIVAQAPKSHQKILRDAFDGTASKKRAIQAMCLECCGHVRATIRNCTGYSCPLWFYRPYQKGETR